MERERAGDVVQMRPECKRTTTAKLNDYRWADFTSGYRFDRSISGNPDIDSQHYPLYIYDIGIKPQIGCSLVVIFQ